MQPLDALTTPLERSLIEASAGTGKTYTITTLFLRLLLEGGLSVGRILVVTFTNAATRELYDRIRTRVREAATAFEIGHSDDEVLAALLLASPDRARDRDRLRTALRDFDDAAIFTIHGLCQRILHEHAFESGTSFEAELQTSQESLIAEVVDDFFARTLYDASPSLVRQMVLAGLTRQSLVDLARKAVADPGMPVLPEAPDERAFEASLAAFAAAKSKAAALWSTDRERVLRAIDDARLSQVTYKPATIAAATAQMDQLLRRDRDGGTALFKRFELFTTTRLEAGRTKKSGPTPSHPFFAACDALLDASVAADRDASGRLLLLRREVIAFARREVPLRKENAGLQSFDDLLHRLDAALAGPRGAALAAAIRGKYAAALIDEFQDTDPVQYRIFHAIYRDAESTPQFFIGDPKQAIYSFRGADVFAYLRAARDTRGARRFTLGTSYRSDPGLVEAVNTLFARARDPFLLGEIGFSRVKAAKGTRMQVGGAKSTPLRILFFARERGPKDRSAPMAKGSAERALPIATAADIARLLASGAQIEGRPVSPGDIAVLVRKNRQAAAVQAALRDLSIPCVVQGDASVFDSPEALEMQQLLGAMAAPSSASAIRLALSTSVFGMSADRIEALDRDDAAWEEIGQQFQSWGKRWESHGFIAGFRRLLDDLQVPSRLLAWTDGERRLTNLLHLAERLHVAQIEQHLAPAGLLRWLTTVRHEQDAREQAGTEAAQIRLESDDAAVKLVTIHKSKGLEYGIVYCPYLWDGKLLREEDEASPLFHDPADDHRRKLDLGSDLAPAHASLARREAAAENLRLLYVALTRAKHQCVVVWGNVKDASTSALGYLLHQERADASDLFAATEQRLLGLDDEAMLADLAALTAEAKESITVEPLSLDAGARYAKAAEASLALEFRPISRSLDAFWRTGSFSGLIAGGSADATEVDDGRDRDDVTVTEPVEVALALEPPADASERVLLHAFPMGARPGEMLHKVFEDIDFGATEEEIAAAAAISLDRFQIANPDEWRGLLGRAVREALETPLRAPGAGDDATFTLGVIPREKRLNELEFIFPVAPGQGLSPHPVTAQALGEVFERHACSPVPDDYAVALKRLSFLPLEGFLRGFIDLVFEHEGRYYVVDYKSNHLGPAPGDYGAGALTAAMAHHHYFLQYHLYVLALHRYLETRLQGYAYETHFGGVFYLFVRGMAPGRGDNAGVFADRPPLALVLGLSALFAGQAPSSDAAAEAT